ncbi:capsule assembly Wzi family protein [Gallaecimonas mangrovi]|uniref:capsule assembly Wzi family protein n=1 Tax=Gallaecimonas mangrovi TaxID=2291597 RepID=UPI000E20000A|nr:capsule assembly Wzi family protein [Gallaecimonas mangrovi]
MLFRVSALASLVLISSAAAAKGVSPYLPLSLSPEIEHQVERVMILADQPVMTRPIPAAAVLAALPKACKKDEALCEQVHSYLDRLMQQVGVSQASVEASVTNNNSNITLANSHGMDAASHYQASFSGYWQPSDYLLFNAGFVSYQGDTTPTGTMVSVGTNYAQLDIGYRDHWLSPMTDSSMLISTNAQTMPSVTLSNYTPISIFNVHYEMFLAQMSSSDHIVYNDGYTSGHPMLAGLHLSFEPIEGWSLGINRVMQYGGGARGGKSLKDVIKAYFDPSGEDNAKNGQTADQQFGNQAASFTSRIIFPGEVPFSVYFEYAGEDTSKSENWNLGNVGLSGGIDFPKLWNNWDLTVEMSEWQNGWYTHHIYLDGLTNNDVVIGNWAANQRVFNDSVGGRSLMVKLGWQPHFGGLAQFQFRTVQNQNYGEYDYQRGLELTTSYSFPWRNYMVGAELLVGRDTLGENYDRLSAYIHF